MLGPVEVIILLVGIALLIALATLVVLAVLKLAKRGNQTHPDHRAEP